MDSTIINIKGLVLNITRKQAAYKRTRINLTDNEWLLLDHLAKKPVTASSIEELTIAVWGTPHKSEGMIRQLVKALRDNIAQYCEADLIKTVHGKGYLLTVTPQKKSSRSLSTPMKRAIAGTLFVAVLGVCIYAARYWHDKYSMLTVLTLSTFDVSSLGVMGVQVSPNNKYSLIEYEQFGQANNMIALYDNTLQVEHYRFRGERPVWSSDSQHFSYVKRKQIIDTALGTSNTSCELFKTKADITPEKSTPLQITCNNRYDSHNYPYRLPPFYFEDNTLGHVHVYNGDRGASTDIHAKKYGNSSEIIQQDIEGVVFKNIFSTYQAGIYIGVVELGTVTRYNANTKTYEDIGKINGDTAPMLALGNQFIFKNDDNGLTQMNIYSGQTKLLLPPQKEPISYISTNGLDLYITLGYPTNHQIFELDKDFRATGAPIADDVKFLSNNGQYLYYLAEVESTWRLFKVDPTGPIEIFDTQRASPPYSLAINLRGEFVMLYIDELLFRDKSLKVPYVYENVVYLNDDTIVYDYYDPSVGSGQVFTHDLNTGVRNNIIRYEEEGKIRTSSVRINPVPYKNGVLLSHTVYSYLYYQPIDGLMEQKNLDINIFPHTNTIQLVDGVLYFTDQVTHYMTSYDLVSETKTAHEQLISQYFTHVNGKFYAKFPSLKTTQILKIELEK